MTEGWTRRCPTCREDRPLALFIPTHSPCLFCRSARKRELAELRRDGLCPPPIPADSWPAERIERLLDLADKGLPRPEIAALLGTSKNAVIGKLRRLNYDPAPILSIWDRLRALHDKMDAVLAETQITGMYLPRQDPKSLLEERGR